MRNLTLDNTAEVIMIDDKKVKKEEIRAWCHICIPPKGFPSIDKLQEHTLKEHRVFKG